MITPRRTRLLRVRGLHAFRQAIVDAVHKADGPRAVVVPTTGAAVQLRRALGRDDEGLVTRDALYDCLLARLSIPPRRLTAFEREAIARTAARQARAQLVEGRDDGAVDAGTTKGTTAGGQDRAGAVAAMLRFYDQLRRQRQSVARFEELLRQALERDAEFDRGASRMLWQTRFLAAAFCAYEERVEASGACDEHTLRGRLAIDSSPSPLRAVIVTVGDWIADPGGLYPADFDLLTRVPGLEALDIVATEAVLGSGFHERIHQWLPGLEEVDVGDTSSVGPRLVVPADASPRWWFTARDREEELIDIVRRTAPEVLRRSAIVYKRPLPYLYLAGEVFGSARIPFRTSDTVPLAAEPAAAALDLVLDVVTSSFTRAAIVALLRSPHFGWAGGAALPREPVAALDRALAKARYLGGVDHLSRLRFDWESAGDHAAALPALRVAIDVARELSPLRELAPLSSHLERILSFLDLRRPAEDRDLTERERRARAAVVATLEALASAARMHDRAPMDVHAAATLVRRSIEEQTFAAAPNADAEAALWLGDDQAARYGEFDGLTIVGLVEGEWPEPPQHNIFFGPSLLSALGWPSEKDSRAGAEARFLDLVGSPSDHVTLSTITLENEALVEAAAVLDQVPRAGLSALPMDRPMAGRVLLEEALSIDPPLLASVDPDVRTWAEARLARSPAADAIFHGQAGPVSRTWSVSAIETYLDCPFKFFARHVLRLQEEPEDEEVMDPRRQGELVHGVFEEFFRRWQARGRRAVTPRNLEDARAMFAEVVEDCLEGLPETEAGLERTRLIGSPAAAGLGDAVLRMEAERPVDVVERLLEQKLEGRFTFETAAGPRAIELRGKADRIDLLDDGTFRLIDYKLGNAPNRRRALQLPIYGLCAEQALAGRAGREWSLSEAAYLAFKGPRRVVPLFSSPGDRERVLSDAQQRLADAVDAIDRGDFPPHPADIYRCETCEYSAVCRKDYVGDV